MLAVRFLFVAVMLMSAVNVSAALIRFDYSFAGSGTIDGTNFSDAAISVTAFGDTDDRMTSTFAFFIDHDSAFVTIEGVGEFGFVTVTRTFVNGSVVGLSRGGFSGADLITGPAGDAFTDWDMLTGIGPVASLGSIVQWGFSAVITSGGILELDDEPGVLIAFEATVVPVPGAIWLFVSGLLACWVRITNQAASGS